MKLTIHNQEFECSKAIKGKDYIKLYDSRKNEIAVFLGITDFASYGITDGTWSNPEPTEAERLASAEKAILALMGGASHV